MFDNAKRRLEDVGITKEQLEARIKLHFPDMEAQKALISAISVKQNEELEAMPEDWLWQNGYRPLSKLALVWINEDDNTGWNPYH